MLFDLKKQTNKQTQEQTKTNKQTQEQTKTNKQTLAVFSLKFFMFFIWKTSKNPHDSWFTRD